jgi:uncharacterized RDD family membrane protein YckC
MSPSTTNQANPYAPPKAFVQDVVDSGAPQERAGRGRRLGAAMIDGTLWATAVYVPLLYGGLVDAERARLAPEDVPMSGWAITVVASIALALINLHYVNQNGQSLAKKWLGIKVLRADGSRATLGRIFWLRNVVGRGPSLLLGGLWTLIDCASIFGEKRQCLHDKIADTIVVNA